MAADRIVIKRLAFTGPEKALKDLPFVPGLNVLWGASNAGKSFMIKSLDFMFGGGTPLPGIAQLQGYDRCWIELDLPRSGATTLSRSPRGGSFAVYADPVENALGTDPEGTLSATHSSGTDSLSGYLLDQVGIQGKQIASTLSGDKVGFSVRHLARYMFTEETPMMSEAAPIRISERNSETLDRNVLKFILSGIDDSAVVVSKSTKEQRTANSGKIEIVDEMIASTQAELAKLFPQDDAIDELDLAAQNERLTASLRAYHTTLSAAQQRLDLLVQGRRRAKDELENLHFRIASINSTVDRFGLLENVYNSDMERLEALEEGAAALMAGARRPCPLCGADPAHQHEAHGLEVVELSRAAVVAEIVKIRGESSDLKLTVRSLTAEWEGLVARAAQIQEQLAQAEIRIAGARPAEVQARKSYEEIDQARQRIKDGLALKRRIDSLKVRRQELESFKAVKTSDPVVPGISGPLGHEFAMTVQSILHEWQFPGEPVVSFSEKHDILLNGSDRGSNGKGVRALMNAAFKIGVLIFCREHNLPHPGIVALDSPLLSYRDPHTSRHGELSADEQQVKNAGLNTYFYEYLERQSSHAQFIIVENDPPPFKLGPDAMVTTFSGPVSVSGRSPTSQRSGLL
ncbi:hypothetical protein GGQ73_002945 [Rhizobium skierniewicense]|uniref:Rad50/SbcC-type AAA domain-containing protein n=1 Tax=Rhizobium skierniewicense TaxID=984260 RepID=A0A7W6CGY8_9HYPH|nr:hypothetical protein [Rhizobium skierniewicense]MBB3946981.1 hypothetical protein [Rhizobium skierniewicense]